MKIHQVKMLIEEGEGFELEFKRKVSSPEKIARTLSAFANTKGGIVLFGVDDDGSLVGVESEKTELDLLEQASRYFCEPAVAIDVEFVPYNHRDIIVVTVNESDEKPHYVVHDGEEKKAYIRVNDNTVAASREVIKVLRDERSSKGLVVSIGENEKRLFDYLERHQRITVKEYSAEINVSIRRASRILTTLIRAGVVRIHTLEKTDYFTLASAAAESAGSHTTQYRMRRQH